MKKRSLFFVRRSVTSRSCRLIRKYFHGISSLHLSGLSESLCLLGICRACTVIPCAHSFYLKSTAKQIEQFGLDKNSCSIKSRRKYSILGLFDILKETAHGLCAVSLYLFQSKIFHAHELYFMNAQSIQELGIVINPQHHIGTVVFMGE